MTNEYKLYQDGRFFNYLDNIDETAPLENLSNTESKTRANLQKILDRAEQESVWINEKEESE